MTSLHRYDRNGRRWRILARQRTRGEERVVLLSDDDARREVSPDTLRRHYTEDPPVGGGLEVIG